MPTEPNSPARADNAIASTRNMIDKAAREAIKLPVHIYRWTVRPWLGWRCRHLPTCSDYALEAIDTNGPWRGMWLTLSRLSRCRPLGSAGFDPVPDIRSEQHTLAPWRYGRWTGRHINAPWTDAGPNDPNTSALIAKDD